MLVKELIEELKKCNQDLEVRISQFSGEYHSMNGGPIYESEDVTEVAEMSSKVVHIYGYQEPISDDFEYKGGSSWAESNNIC